MKIDNNKFAKGFRPEGKSQSRRKEQHKSAIKLGVAAALTEMARGDGEGEGEGEGHDRNTSPPPVSDDSGVFSPPSSPCGPPLSSPDLPQPPPQSSRRLPEAHCCSPRKGFLSIDDILTNNYRHRPITTAGSAGSAASAPQVTTAWPVPITWSYPGAYPQPGYPAYQHDAMPTSPGAGAAYPYNPYHPYYHSVSYLGAPPALMPSMGPAEAQYGCVGRVVDLRVKPFEHPDEPRDLSTAARRQE